MSYKKYINNSSGILFEAAQFVPEQNPPDGMKLWSEDCKPRDMSFGYVHSVLFGTIHVMAHEWIIRNIVGELLYVVNQTTFEFLYEPYEDKKNIDECWISIKDKLPCIDEYIEVRFYSKVNHDYETSRCRLVSGTLSMYFYFEGTNEFVEDWRPLPEKRPDFGKLNIGDKLIIDIMSNDSKGSKVIEYFGYFQGISESNMLNISINTYSFIGDCISVSRVKKITRINIEKQTFEEI